MNGSHATTITARTTSCTAPNPPDPRTLRDDEPCIVGGHLSTLLVQRHWRWW